MALTPPNNNEGIKTKTWSLVLATNNQIIDRSDMPDPSTVEYKGYYKAEATGIHKFSLNGTSNDITGYSWVSSAPANSDHIKRNNRGARLVFNNSFAIQIPVKNRFKNESILGGLDFPGYGYWPKFKSGGPGVELQYGNLQGFNYIYSGRDAPSTDCSHNQVGHQYLVPGDVRTYGVNEFPKFAGRPAGPGWQAPEDPNFSAPCWPSEYARPLVAVDNTLIPDQVDNFAVSTTQGRKSQITLDNGFIAGGSENYAKFQRVAVDENNPDHIYIWPMAIPQAALEPPRGEIWNKITEPQRIQIRFGVMFRQETQDYTFEWKSRDGLKMWYRLSQPNDNRYFQKFPTTSGNNPCNFTAQYTGNSGWLPGGGFDGFTGKLKIKQNTWVVFNGFGVGDPGDETHGFSIVIKNSNGDIVFDSTDLLDRGGKIGIDECGYHALLNDESRVPGNRVAEFYDNDGWNGIDNDIFTADSVVGDNNERDPSTTRQYLWSNAITRTGRGDSNFNSGEVFLRQGDYYFIRTIVSSNVQNGGFTFKVTTPIGESKSVMFSGNSNPGSDTSVGGSYGGAGIAKDTLCGSILFNNGVAISDNTNFAVVDKMGVVLNLDRLGLSSGDIGKEGQDEKITGSTGGGTKPPPPSTECIESQSQKCAPYDFGPGGDYAGGATYQVEVGPGQVVSMPFTVVPGDWSGKISRYPTSSSGNVPDGAYGRFWLSATPGGEPLSIDSSEVGGTEAAWRWHLAGATDAEGFEIPNVAAVYYYNWTRCGPPDSDRTCSDPSTPPAMQTHDIYFRGTKSQGSGGTVITNECTDSEGQKCEVWDFGPGGRHSTGNTFRLDIEPHTVHSMPFTIVEGNFDGAITRAPTSQSLAEHDGCYPRHWISETPGGPPLSADCAQLGGTEGDLRWHQPGSRNTYGCEIPSINAVYYYNVARCGIDDETDLNCSNPINRVEGQQHLDTYLAGRKTGDTLSRNTTISTNNRDTSGSSGSAELKFEFNTLYPTIKITLDELVRDGGQEISTDKERSWIVINEYIKQKDANLTMEYSEFVGAINNQAVMRWGSGGNYQYVYHAVSVIIESICNGTEITQTDTSGVNDRTNNNNVGEPTCIEIDVTNIAGGAGLITSECLDECKHPKDYPALSTEYQKYKSNYVNSDSSYYDSIVIEKDATLYYKGPDKDAPNGGKNSLFQSRIDKGIRFEPGEVTSIPFTVPDYYEPDWINSAVASKLNSFYVDIDPANIIGDGEPGSEPGLLVWWSTYAGGPALGRPYLLAGIIDSTEVFATFSPFILNKYPDTNIVGYLGNKYGTRWINFTTFNTDLTTSTSINDLEIGSTAFMARMSSLGLAMKDKFSLSMQIPVPDCSKLGTVSPITTTQTSDTMKSLPNMNPYIGDDWDGNVPRHVEIATNSGFTWNSVPGGSMTAYQAGMGPGDPSPRLTGNTIWFPQPTNGKILSYVWTSSNEKIVPYANFGWVWSPRGGQQALKICSPVLTCVRWMSATPGGRPLMNARGERPIFNVGDADADPSWRLQQLYDLNDSEIPYYITIPVINKKYFMNAAVIEDSLYATLAAEERAPTASEVREFNPTACGSENSYAYVVSGPRGTIYDFDTWLQENTQ